MHGHVDAEQNNTSSTTVDVNLDLQVASIAINPTAPKSGDQVTVSWNDTNTGVLPAGGAWNRRYADGVTVRIGVTAGRPVPVPIPLGR